MAEETPAEDHASRRGLRTSRLEAFSDGVFAIAITLLVLDIAIPVATSPDLLAAVKEEWPSYLAYLVSFSTIGSLWLAHSVVTEFLEHADAVFLRLNLLFLLLVSLLPFPTRLVSEYIGNENAERVAGTVYGANLLLASAMLAVLWRYAARARLLVPTLDDVEARTIANRVTPGVGAYLVLMVIGFWRPLVAVVGYLVVAIFLMLPFRRPDNRQKRQH